MILFPVLLLACNRKPGPVVEPQPLPFAFSDTLLRIDSVMRHDASTAMTQLLLLRPTDTFSSFRPTEGSGEIPSQFNANYQSLLLSEALYKTDNAQSNRDEVQTAVQYFDSIYAIYHTDELAMFAARSHYMNGVGHYENDSVVDALKEYLRTLEIMENHFEDNDITGYRAKFMGLTYTRMGEVYYTNNLAEIAVESYKNALRYFERVPYYSLANTYRHIGASYYLDSRQDSALYYYRKAILMTNGQKSFVHSASLSESAPIYYDLGFIDSAFIMIKKSMSLTTNKDQRLVQCYTYGLLYWNEHRYDSALYYFKQSVERENYSTRTASEEKLIDCYLAVGDTANAKVYKLKHHDNLKLFVENSTFKVDLLSLYEKNSLIKLEKQHQQTLNQRRHVFFIVLLSVVLLIICVVLISLYTHKKKDTVITNLNTRIKANSFEQEPICVFILNLVKEHHFKAQIDYRIYADNELGVDQLRLLRNAVDVHFNHLTDFLKRHYTVLTDDDINYCCLYLLGLKDADISALMQRSYRAVCDRNKKLRRIFRIDYSINTFLREIVFTGFQD